MTVLTHEAIAAKVRELAAENPDFVYKIPEGGSSCVYFHDDQPSCIIGQALASFGVTADQLPDKANYREYGASLDPSYEYDKSGKKYDPIVMLGITGDRRFVDWLSRVQQAQDGGDVWGNAIKAADGWVEI